MIREEPIAVLPDYATVQMAFEVGKVLEVQPVRGERSSWRLKERAVNEPWVKDYDSYKGEGPSRWAARWDISNWAIISAYIEGERVGGCVIAYHTDGVDMLEGRTDVAVLWDLRVAPEYRGQGIGGRLVEAAIAWAKDHHCRLIKVETQNINVPACRLYGKHGFVLGSVNRNAYPELPEEIQLIWHQEL